MEKERKQKEKLEKFAAKKAKLEAEKKAAAATTDSKKKEKKAKAEAPPAEVEYVEETPPGEKKSMQLLSYLAKQEMQLIILLVLKSLEDPAYKAYNPTVVESAWYSWWEKEGFFEPELTADGKPKPEGCFVIPAPPPNVTGALHIGHGLTIAIQDTLIRW